MWVDLAGASGSGMGTYGNANNMTNEFNPRLRDEPKNKKQKNALKAFLISTIYTSNENVTSFSYFFGLNVISHLVTVYVL